MKLIHVCTRTPVVRWIFCLHLHWHDDQEAEPEIGHEQKSANALLKINQRGAFEKLTAQEWP